MLRGKRVIAKKKFSIAKMTSGRIAMRLKKKDFRTLDKSKRRKMVVTYVLETSFGKYTTKLTLKR